MFKVIETCMFPNKWKVESIQFPGRDNSFVNYFKDFANAQKECDRRNKKID